MEEQKKFNVVLPPDIAGGIYSNLAVVAHSPHEFIIDFASMMPGAPQPIIRSRIVMTPENAKRLLAALRENIENYDSKHGGDGNMGGGVAFPFGFGGAQGNA